MNYTGRLDRIAAQMAADGLDAVMITHLPNVRHACGYVGSNGVVVVTADRRVLFTDFRYLAASRARAGGVEVEEASRDLLDKVGALIASAGSGARVGFESEHTSVARLEHLEATVSGVEWVATKGLVENVRLRKDSDEIALMAEASRIADAAFAACADGIFRGRTEKQVAWELEGIMRAGGAERPSFDIIVASGPRGAMPHAVPGDDPILAGTLVTVDLGAVLEGYHSDCTRTFATGPLSDELTEAYDVCLAAQELALAAVRPGISGGDLDAVARDHIKAAGLGEHFRHGLGHGVGLDIHERPWAREGIAEALEAGMTVTIEPGIYLEGTGGVRIEDLVVVTDDGCRVLTGFTKERLQVDS